jgi:hypothetical protein
MSRIASGFCGSEACGWLSVPQPLDLKGFDAPSKAPGSLRQSGPKSQSCSHQGERWRRRPKDLAVVSGSIDNYLWHPEQAPRPQKWSEQVGSLARRLLQIPSRAAAGCSRWKACPCGLEPSCLHGNRVLSRLIMGNSEVDYAPHQWVFLPLRARTCTRRWLAGYPLQPAYSCTL